MKEVTLSFSEEELLELARQLTAASIFNIYDEHTPTLADSIHLKVCATGYKEFNSKADSEWEALPGAHSL